MSEQNNNDYWLKGELMDFNGLTEAQQKLAGNYASPKKPKHDFEFVDQAQQKAKISADDFTEADLQELARKDPNGFGRQYHDSKMDQVTVAFKKANPSYLPVLKNFEAVVDHIRKYQLHDEDLPDDDVISAAYDAGFWTLENLTGTFKVLARQGKMKMRPNQPKTLSKDEMLRVISFIRANDLDGAVVSYLQQSYGGQLPTGYSTVREFLIGNPNIAARASWFVWENHHAGDIDPADLRAFKKSMAHVPLPTMATLEVAYLSWRERGPSQPQQIQPQQQPAPAPIDLNSLSDAELDKVIAEERKKYFKSR